MNIREFEKQVMENKGGIAKFVDFVVVGIRAADIVNICNAGYLNRVRYGYYQLAEMILLLKINGRRKCNQWQK